MSCCQQPLGMKRRHLDDRSPFVHSFNAAISPPWETRTDWNIFKTIAAAFSELAETHLGNQTDLIAAPLLHDSPDLHSLPAR